MHLKANGLNPETYLNYLLSVLPERFADDPQAQVDDLMPWCGRFGVDSGVKESLIGYKKTAPAFVR